MTNDYSNRRVLVYDSGYSVNLALSLSKYFGEVLFYTNWRRTFPSMTELAIGTGYEEIIRVVNFWERINDVDLFVFLYCDNGDLQTYLDSIGKRVWGSRNGSNLELSRWKTKELLESFGLPNSDGEQVRGLDNLRALLKKKKNCFIKISRWRGDMESWHHINYELSEPRLDELAFRLGPLKHLAVFIVEDEIKTEIELGYSGLCVDGVFPNIAIQDYESKDEGLIASFMPYSQLPEEVSEVNDRLSEFLKKEKYRNFFATEIRIGEDSLPYMIDACCRPPVPCSTIQIANYKNIADILWCGAVGDIVPIEIRAQFGAEAMIYSDWAHKHWMTVQVSEPVRPYVSLFNSVNIGKEIEAVAPPNQDLAVIGNEIGSVIGLGDTVEEAIEECREHAKGIEGMGIKIKSDALESLLPQIKEAQEKGIKFSDEPIPESV
jgi:hypothetical protein